MAIVFRCDASLAIGSGHVMRCLTLARELRRQGQECHLISRRLPGDLLDQIAADFPLHILPALQEPQAALTTAADDHASWLSCSQEQDALDTLAALDTARLASIAWLVVDHYALDGEWHQRLRAGLHARDQQPRLLVIDDLASRPLQADLLLDQNRLDSEEGHQLYQPLLPPGCRCLIGPHFALLGEPFRLLQPLLPQRRAPLQRLLIFLGGADLPNLTERCLVGLLEPTPLPLKLDVVLGQANPHRKRIEALLANHPQVQLHQGLPSLAGLMAQADLAIGAGGVTSWERACLGLPALVASLAPNQNEVIRQLAAAGAVVDLGTADDITPALVREQVCTLLANPEQLARLSRQAAGISDGWGSTRVAAAMLGRSDAVQIRPATTGDEALWLRWANDPATRSASFNGGAIAAADHHQWFHRRLAEPGTWLLVAVDSQGLPLGYVRFEEQPRTNNSPQELLISLALEPAVRGQGRARPILEAAITHLSQRRPGPFELIAEVKPNNQPSQRLFLSCGFQPCPPRRAGGLCFHRPTL